jgi:hypothetical protein
VRAKISALPLTIIRVRDARRIARRRREWDKVVLSRAQLPRGRCCRTRLFLRPGTVPREAVVTGERVNMTHVFGSKHKAGCRQA